MDGYCEKGESATVYFRHSNIHRANVPIDTGAPETSIK